MEVEYFNWESDERSDLEELQQKYTVICVKRFRDEQGAYELDFLEKELGSETECEIKNCIFELQSKCGDELDTEEIRKEVILEGDQINCTEMNRESHGNVIIDAVNYHGVSEFNEELIENYCDFTEKFCKYFETSNFSFRCLQNKYIKQLFGIRKDYLYKKVTRGFIRHLGRLRLNIHEKNTKKLNFFDKNSKNFRDLYKESHEFYSSNHETVSKLKGTIKIVTLSNCYHFFSDKAIKHLYQLFTEMVFTCKPRLQLSSNLKIPVETESISHAKWEMRKIYIKDLLFLYQSTNGKLIFR